VKRLRTLGVPGLVNAEELKLLLSDQLSICMDLHHTYYVSYSHKGSSTAFSKHIIIHENVKTEYEDSVMVFSGRYDGGTSQFKALPVSCSSMCLRQTLASVFTHDILPNRMPRIYLTISTCMHLRGLMVRLLLLESSDGA
jgi:hypothetical protein